MRGIEGALAVWRDVRNGRFASEALRRAGASMEKADVVLAASLVYTALRRRSLWEEIYGRFLRRPGLSLSRRVEDALCLGTAGILERRVLPRSVAGLVQRSREGRPGGGARERRVDRWSAGESCAGGNPVLRPEDQARVGDPMDPFRVKRLVGREPGTSSPWEDPALRLLRLSPRRPTIIAGRRLGIRCWASPGSGEPPARRNDFQDFRYHDNVTPKRIVHDGGSGPRLPGGAVLDMCSGRGIKTGHLLDLLPDVHSVRGASGRAAAARKDLERLGHGLKLPTLDGDALHMEPSGRRPVSWTPPVPAAGHGTGTPRANGA